MNKSSSITIINDKNIRGIVAPSNVITQETLEDMIDFVELSSEKTLRETQARIKQANGKKLWISLAHAKKKVLGQR